MSENQPEELKYKEFQKGRSIDITFRKICADSSGTRKKQKEGKKGMSIVAFFSERDKQQIRNDIISQIQDLHYGFVSPDNLHTTFLNIYPSKNIFQENSNSYFNDLIITNLRQFFDNKPNNSALILNFDEFRPGTWHGFNNMQIPDASDGTVIAMGNPQESGNESFVNLADQLVCDLKNKLRPIFNDEFDRKFPTMWTTLGYFDHLDFGITKEFADIFKLFKKPLEIEVNKLSLVEYSYKDLRDAQILQTYEL